MNPFQNEDGSVRTTTNSPPFDSREMVKDLKMLFGLDEFNGPSNPCVGDSYFASSLERKYSRTIEEMSRLTGLRRRS